VSFLHDLYLVALERKFEQSNGVVAHELRRNRAAREIWKLLKAARDVLAGLSHSQLVHTSLGLDRYDELLTVPVDTHIDFVDFDLSHFFTKVCKWFCKE
jgi:hypothetical protein